jgi:Protein phosphatase 2C
VTIGDPGRAAREVRAGLPCQPWGWPDTAVDSASVSGLEARAASCRGLLHRYDGSPRQDAYSLGMLDADAGLVLTVCDGVGSLPRSHEAAAAVCAVLPGVVSEILAAEGELDWSKVFERASDAIVAIVESYARPGERPHRARDCMATTVLCAVFRPESPGRVSVELAWIGDSVAWQLDGGGHWVPLGPGSGTPDPALPSSAPAALRDGVTSALPGDQHALGRCSTAIGPGDAVFLMTDGVGDPLGTGAGEVGAALAALWAAPPDMLAFAAQVGFARRSFDDDRTVAGVWFPTEGGHDGRH